MFSCNAPGWKLSNERVKRCSKSISPRCAENLLGSHGEMGDSYIPYVLQTLATTQRGARDGNPPWLPNFPAFSKAMESDGQKGRKCSTSHPVAAASGTHPAGPQPHREPRRGGDRGHPSTRCQSCIVLGVTSPGVTVGRGKRAVKNLRNDWKRAVATFEAT